MLSKRDFRLGMNEMMREYRIEFSFELVNYKYNTAMLRGEV